jgi:hypothetical protein
MRPTGLSLTRLYFARQSYLNRKNKEWSKAWMYNQAFFYSLFALPALLVGQQVAKALDI